MQKLAVMYDQFCVVPFWGTPSPEVDNLSDCSVSYDDNSTSEVISRYPYSDSKQGHLLDEGLEDTLEWIFTPTEVRNDGQFLLSVDSESDQSSYYDDNDISWLDDFMNVYGVTTLDSNDDFNMKSIDMTVVTPQAKENHSGVVLTSMEEMKSDGILTNECVTQLSIVPDNTSVKSIDICTDANANMFSAQKLNATRKTFNGVVTDNDKIMQLSAKSVLDESVSQKSRIDSPSDHSFAVREKFAVKRICFDGISERKREQNRCAAIRYRGKRREEAKQKKQELHKLELRNIELKTEMNWLEKEIIYLKSLMKLTKGF
uniref:BZIP domain-containing protein n=1 Tax=Elaeophora elaphi TaxID=1147741 RepID=A0A0R3S146_9BILA